MIDYVLVSIEGAEKIKELKVIDRVESDHMPIMCKLENRLIRKGKKVEEEVGERINWDERSKASFQPATMGKAFE